MTIPTSINSFGIVFPDNTQQTTTSNAFLTPEAYGAKGTGSDLETDDDSAAIQSAIDAAHSAGGGIIFLKNKYSIRSNIIVKPNVTLQGSFNALTWVPSYFNWYGCQSQLKIFGDATVRCQIGSSMKNLLLMRNGLTLITGAESTRKANNINCQRLLDQFGGIAITLEDTTSVNLCDLMILGFERAIYMTLPVSRGGAGNLVNIRGDCKNGILVQWSYDVLIIDKCHFWPYLTVDIVGSDPSRPYLASNVYNARPGTAFSIVNRCDWGKLINSFSYGYQYGFDLLYTSNFSVENCGADNINFGVPEAIANITGIQSVVSIGDNIYKTTLSITESEFQYPKGTVVTITGANPTALNGSWSVVDATFTTFSISQNVNPGTGSASGTVKVPGQCGYRVLDDFPGDPGRDPAFPPTSLALNNVTTILNSTCIAFLNPIYADCYNLILIGNRLAGQNDRACVYINRGTLAATNNSMLGGGIGFQLSASSGKATFQGNDVSLCTFTGYQIPAAIAQNTYVDGWTPWIDYTSNIGASAGSGSFTSVTVNEFKYRKSVNNLEYRAKITVGNQGSAGSDVRLAPLPVASSANIHCGTGRQDGINGYLCQSAVNSGNQLVTWTYDNAFPGATNSELTLSGRYPIAASITLV